MSDIKQSIWAIKNKAYLIAELKELISDLEDEHYSTPGFFQNVEYRLAKWKREHEMERDHT